MHEPKCSVPLPILEAPNEYVPALLNHLYNVFVPRLDGGKFLLYMQLDNVLRRRIFYE